MSYTESIPVYAPFERKVYRSTGGLIDQGSESTGTKYATGVLTGYRTGVKVENYKTKIAEGSDAGSPYSIDVYDCLNVEGLAETSWKYPSDSFVTTDSFAGVLEPCVEFPHLSSPLTQTDSDALAGVLSKIRNTRSQMNGLVFIGELRETLRMLRNPAFALTEKISSHIRNLEKEKSRVRKLPWKKRGKEWSKVIAGLHLEAVFGWMPLFSDIEDISKSLLRLSENKPKQLRVSATKHQESVEITPYGVERALQGYSSLPLMLTKQKMVTSDHSVRYIAGLETQEVFDKGSLLGMLETFGFSLENFIPAIYELMPWSFLIDYFSNLGKVIEAGTTDTSAVKWSVKVTRSRSVRNFLTTLEDPHLILAAEGRTYIAHGGHYGYSRTIRTTLTRTIPGDLGVPPLYFTHPGGNVKKILNLVALLELMRHSSRDLSWLGKRG